MSSPEYRGRHRAPAGRHRAARTTTSTPTPSPTTSPTPSSTSAPRAARRTTRQKLTGSGYLLPGAAAATLVLTATGFHLSTSAAAPAVAGAPTSTAITASGLLAEDAIQRADQEATERAARDSSRTTAAMTGVGGADGSALGAEGEASRSDQQALVDGQDRDQAQQEAAAKSAADAAAKAAEEAAAKAKADADAAAQQKAADDAAAAAAASAKGWVPFIDGGYTLTSGFGMRWGSMHPGQDFAVAVGTPVKAMSSGTVIFAGWQGGYGNKVEIQYWDGTVSWFCHNSQLNVSQGESVTPGEVVSLSGNTGHSTGPHIHVEIHPANGDPIPPIPWLTAKGAMP